MRPALLVLGGILLVVAVGVWFTPGFPLTALAIAGNGVIALGLGAFTKTPDQLTQEALVEFQRSGSATEPLRPSAVPEWARSVWWYGPSGALAAVGVATLTIPSWGLTWLGPELIVQALLWVALIYTALRTD